MIYDDEVASYISTTDYYAMLEASGIANDEEVQALRTERQDILDKHSELKNTLNGQQERFADETLRLQQRLEAMANDVRAKEHQIEALVASEADALAQAAALQNECNRLHSQVRIKH